MDRLIKTLPAILKASGASEEVVEAACIAAWKHAVGEGLSSYTAPIQLQQGTLVVVVADNIWKTQLEQIRGQLLFRLNSVVGQESVKAIEFRIDPKMLADILGTNAGRVEGSTRTNDYRIPFELLSAAAEIEDADLRRAFLGAAASCLNRLEEL
jgi:predicted nucleic acid-binding Zn ribbon protein